MKTLTLIFLFLQLALCGHAQIISIEKIKAVPKSEFNNTKDSTLIFPVFRMKNKTVENKINQKLKNDFKKARDIEKNENNVRSMLRKASEEGLTGVDYDVIYHTKKLISLNFQWEATGAYSSTWHTYYCFNLETGNLVTLDSLIDKTQKRNFLSLVKKKQSSKINGYKKELLNQLNKKEVDKETYEWALNNVKDICWSNYDPQKFTIDKNTLTIIIDCDFPHAIKALSPHTGIKLPVKQIDQYINKKYRSMIN